jgi:hypothetical protein
VAEAGPATLLSAIRERGRVAFNDYDAAPWDDWDRLLAAVEAVLKLADQLPPQAPPSSALEEDRMFIRQECADMIREAITSTLTGEDGT